MSCEKNRSLCSKKTDSSLDVSSFMKYNVRFDLSVIVKKKNALDSLGTKCGFE